MDKLILSVQSVLKEKYGKDYPAVLSLLRQLIASDNEKGLQTSLIFLDDRKKLSPLRIAAIDAGKSTAKDYKNCVDALYRSFNPDYILLFGAIDVIPQQKLRNLLYKTDHEDDRWVASDLPYACNSPYSTDPNSFLSPVRVVGRLADINGVADLDLVSVMIADIIAFTPRDKKAYEPYFAVSVPGWRRSTDKSMEKVFTGRVRVNLVPPKKYHWTAAQLQPLSHYFNCHGAESMPEWYGQTGGRFPKSMTPAALSGKIRKNTVVVAECCYGTQLFRPELSGLPDTMPICNAYFKNGAITFLGSSTTAYGPSTTNDQADLITRYFMINILSGASAGRALLDARQTYILNHGPDLSPTDLKTISQFNLLGDPSVQLVRKDAPAGAGPDQGSSADKLVYLDPSRKERRKYLLSKGVALGNFVNSLQPGKKLEAGKTTKAYLRQLLSDHKLADPAGQTFIVRQNAANKKTFRSNGMLSARFHIFLEKKKSGVLSQKLLSVKELEGKVVSVQVYERR
jgi:hypothetical protein